MLVRNGVARLSAHVITKFSLTIGCLDLVGSQFKFSWRDSAPRPNERPAYVVSGGDFLTLVERFGLTPQLADQAVGRHNP